MNGNVTPKIGDLFNSPAQTLVNTVNTVGVMGKGIALEFKKRFPEMHRDYVRRCQLGRVKLGEPYLWAPMFDQWVLNFPTKDHWRSRSKLSDIISGLTYLEQHYLEWGIGSLAVPPLGCGEGGLDWAIVGPTLYRHLSTLAIPVELFAPFGTPPNELDENFLSGSSSELGGHRGRLPVSPASVALVDIVARIQREPYHWPTGRVSFQKLAYFATQAGIPTGLNYIRGSYGPFAPELKRMQSRLENNGVLQERRIGKMFVASPGPAFEDARRAYADQLSEWESAISSVADLLLRFDSRKAEIAATVHFGARELSGEGRSPSELDVLNHVLRWKQRRVPPLNPEDVATTIRHLNALAWIDVAPSRALPLPESEATAVA